jgi:hypothetical protein
MKINCRHQMSVILKQKQQSIIEASTILNQILVSIAKLGIEFEKAQFVEHKKDPIDYCPLAFSLDDGANKIADIIIRLHGREYSYETDTPDITPLFTWVSGFWLNIKYALDAGFKYHLFIQIGDSNINYIDQDRNYDGPSMGFNWHFNLLKAIVDSDCVNSACIRLRNADLNDFSKHFMFQLGWINYFPNDYPLAIPDDLPGIEYEHTPQGKYLILTREDFTVDVEKYHAGKQKLMDLMEELARRVPGYRKA